MPWASGVAALRLGTFHVATHDLRIEVFHEFLGVDLRKTEIDDALNAKGQAQNQCQGHQRHEPCVTLDKLCLQGLVEPHFLDRGHRGAINGHGFVHQRLIVEAVLPGLSRRTILRFFRSGRRWSRCRCRLGCSQRTLSLSRLHAHRQRRKNKHKGNGEICNFLFHLYID